MSYLIASAFLIFVLFIILKVAFFAPIPAVIVGLAVILKLNTVERKN